VTKQVSVLWCVLWTYINQFAVVSCSCCVWVRCTDSCEVMAKATAIHSLGQVCTLLVQCHVTYCISQAIKSGPVEAKQTLPRLWSYDLWSDRNMYITIIVRTTAYLTTTFICEQENLVEPTRLRLMTSPGHKIYLQPHVTFWPLDSQSWPFHAHAPWTTPLVPTHQNWFSHFPNINMMFPSVREEKDGQI